MLEMQEKALLCKRILFPQPNFNPWMLHWVNIELEQQGHRTLKAAQMAAGYLRLCHKQLVHNLCGQWP